MKRILRKTALFAIFITVQTSFAEVPGNAFLTEQDSELMQKNPAIEFISLDDDIRQAIIKSAQIDQEKQISNSACIEALRFIEQGFSVIPHELALDVAAEIELKEAEQNADERGCKSKCFNNLRVKNLLTINKLQVCEGGDISGGLTIYGNRTINPGSSPNCRSSRTCNTTPVNTVNAASILNGPATFNCGASLASSACLTDADGDTSICLSDPADTIAMTTASVLKWTLSPNGGIAHGDFNTASGTDSVASGSATQATASDAHAEGYYTVASGTASHAEGYYTTASGNASHAECSKTTASGLRSHAEGGCATANGIASHAEGYLTTSSGRGSHAEGHGSIASGIASHAEGVSTIASGIASHAEGYLTTANASQSHAEGFSTRASGTPSHAEGYNTIASGNSSRAAGQNATAGHNNAYCWSDGNAFSASSTNQFVVKATGTTGGVPGTGIIFNNGAAKPVTTETSGTTATWSYTSGNSANWAINPISIAQALDRIAAKIGPV